MSTRSVPDTHLQMKMRSFATKDEALSLLDFMGVKYSPQTALTVDALNEKLAKAVVLSQRVPNKQTIDPQALKIWKSTPEKPLMHAFKTDSLEECCGNVFREELTGERNVPLGTNAFLDARQTLMALVNFYTKENCTIFLIQDKEESRSITLRIVGLYALDENTPLFAVLFEHGLGHGLVRRPDFLYDRAPKVPRIFATKLEQKLLIRMLELNSKLVVPSYSPSRHYSEKDYVLSFLVPLNPLSLVEIGTLTKSGCVVCGSSRGNKCSQCHSVVYCGKLCQKQDWKSHKQFCKALSSESWEDIRLSFPELAPGLKVSTMLSRTANASTFKNPKIIHHTDASPPPNIHGNDPFLIKIQVPLEPSPNVGLAILVYDHTRSFECYVVQKTDPKAYARVESVVRRTGSMMGTKMYRWAKRIDDWVLSVCLDKEPQGPIQW
ncbi:hypothetical protein DFH11DRAFT_1622833 [Phellopilus nigrolimitatus]|nr:hypothetical protein DFH11DRAFT_1622833 [Phellopilus nigrolimitatus]